MTEMSGDEYLFVGDRVSAVTAFDMVKETILLLFIDTNSVMASPCCFRRRLFLWKTCGAA
jgi:hypothetical protein